MQTSLYWDQSTRVFLHGSHRARSNLETYSGSTVRDGDLIVLSLRTKLTFHAGTLAGHIGFEPPPQPTVFDTLSRHGFVGGSLQGVVYLLPTPTGPIHIRHVLRVQKPPCQCRLATPGECPMSTAEDTANRLLGAPRTSSCRVLARRAATCTRVDHCPHSRVSA
ncbi:hypothetical protein OH77DRAFT_1225005 [Trametes cingulata]|nr:hypothetical protein OH77DRAFT_1225005 [Trametes cingulata]